MKQNQFFFILLIGIGIFTGVSSAQENNYIVSKFDFIPGEKVIFFDDFTSESIGDFPAQWLTNGSGEIVTSEKFPGRWFHITKMGYFIPEAKEDFTENFTIEFDFIPVTTDNGENMYSFTFYLLTGSLSEPGGGGEPGDAGFQVYFDGENLGWKNWSLTTEQRFNGSVTFPFKSNQKYHIAVWVQKQRVRFYANENKVLDVPRAIPSGSKPNIFRFDTRDEAIPLIGNFRIAAGLSDMRNRLLKDGKIISYGIQFDINSDKLKPESYSTLKELSDILKENPAIRIKVVGHTDSDGDDVSNLDLSNRRSTSVKNELIARFGCDGSRLETDGKGESEPIAENNSSVNKAKNRRVEFTNLKTTGVTAPPAKSPVSQKPVQLTDPDGNVYKTVTIGSQTWMAENLKTTKYYDGTPIPLVTDSAKWMYTTTPAYCWFKNDASKYKNPYGALYNWFTVSTGKLCPSGWHVPTDADWSVLKKSVGPSEDTDVDARKLRLAGTSFWKAPNSGANNSTGFSAIATGYREDIGRFYTDLMRTGIITEGALWWSASEDPSTAEYTKDKKPSNGNIVGLSYNHNGVTEGSYPKPNGLSVRCVKD
jgi:OOP family OmpA-OmpF porin